MLGSIRSEKRVQNIGVRLRVRTSGLLKRKKSVKSLQSHDIEVTEIAVEVMKRDTAYLRKMIANEVLSCPACYKFEGRFRPGSGSPYKKHADPFCVEDVKCDT